MFQQSPVFSQLDTAVLRHGGSASSSASEAAGICGLSSLRSWRALGSESEEFSWVEFQQLFLPHFCGRNERFQRGFLDRLTDEGLPTARRNRGRSRRAPQLDEGKVAVSANVHHELRTPLTAEAGAARCDAQMVISEKFPRCSAAISRRCTRTRCGC